MLFRISELMDLYATRERQRQVNSTLHTATIRRAILDGQLNSTKHGKFHMVELRDYIKWLAGWPHKTGPKVKQ